MPLDITMILLGYAVASFILTALFLRLENETPLEKIIRRHFYCFPLMPPVLIVWVLLQGMIKASSVMIDGLRYCFETISVNRPGIAGGSNS